MSDGDAAGLGRAALWQAIVNYASEEESDRYRDETIGESVDSAIDRYTAAVRASILDTLWRHVGAADLAGRPTTDLMAAIREIERGGKA